MRRIWTLALALLLILAPVFAVPTSEPAEAGVTEGTAETYTPTVTNSTNVQAGYVKEVNLDVVDVTKWWAGLFGVITKSVVLANAAGNKFFEWPITTVSGYVYLATHSSLDWSSMQAVQPTDADINADLSDAIGADAQWSPSSDEGVAATFKNQDGSGSYCSVTNAYYVLTYDDTENGVWPTCIYKDGTNGWILYEAKVNQGGKAFNGSTADYQALVAAPNAETGSAVTYYVWLG